MKVAWTSKLDKEVASGIRQSYKEALLIRKRLTEMLEEKSKVSVRSSHSKDGYECANWAYKQADARGYERALREVMDLLKETE